MQNDEHNRFQTTFVAGLISLTPHGAAALLQDPVIHEYIRHGYISALQHWDDICAQVRQSQNHTGRKTPAIWYAPQRP